MAPRRDHVELLELGGGREDHVGVSGGVGEELLADHAEQVVAGQAPAHRSGVGQRHRGVAAPGEQRGDRRPAVRRRLGEGAAELGHVEAAGGRRCVEDRVVDCGLRPRPHRAGKAAADVPPRAGHERQAAERPEEAGAVLVVLGADEGADERRLGLAVAAGQVLDLGRVEAGHGAGTFRCPVRDVGRQLGEPVGVALDVVVVDQVVTHQHVQHGQDQRRVGTGPGLDEPVGGVGGDRADRVDDHDLRAVRPGRLDGGPEVAVGEAGVRCPQDHEPGVTQVARVGAPPRAVGLREAGTCGEPADRARRTRRTEAGEERSVEAGHLDQPLGSRVPPGQDGLTAEPVDDVTHPFGDECEGLVPGGPTEDARALRPRPDQGVQDPVVGVHPVDEAVDLGAELALGEGMARVAAQLHHPAPVDGRDPSARVRAVVMAGAQHGGGAHGCTVASVRGGCRR